MSLQHLSISLRYMDGIRYNIYALGTSGEDSFVREINVCFNHLDRVVYEYDAISDLWTLLP